MNIIWPILSFVLLILWLFFIYIDNVNYREFQKKRKLKFNRPKKKNSKEIKFNWPEQLPYFDIYKE